ncbi:MAG: hypothetical protein P8P74_01220, partial [Crocinitomicaceae bacterium]|nr:hypothetical protein [Crocinitomicaceae bacterium]
SFEEMYVRYTGWFIAFFTKNSSSYDKSLEGTNENEVIQQLLKSGLSEISVIQRAFIGGNNYYEFSAIEGGKKIKVVGIESDMHEHSFDAVLPYYEYIGIGWDPLDI